MYETKYGAEHKILRCCKCDYRFSETQNTPMANLKTPIAKIVLVLKAITEGTSINATSRIFNVSKNSIYRWQERIGHLKETLMLFTLTHNFLHLVIEGDELYTKIAKNTEPSESEGWTIILMNRASRFILEMECGHREEQLFKNAIDHFAKIIELTDDLTLMTDGERRYGNLLFDICHEEIHTGKRGRPRKTLPEGVKVRVKNKGSQSHKKGKKRPKYQAPQPEHPDTKQNIEDKAIHANHVEAFNASLRRICSAYRRKTNTYAKKKERLQERLDLIWVFHNFVKVHHTTRQIPAVALGIMEKALSFTDLFLIQSVA